MLISLNPYHKTSYNTINDDLRKSGHGISYKETRFNENKWTEWAVWSLKQPSIYLFRYLQGHYNDTHVENKVLDSPDNYNTNSILIQCSSDNNSFDKVFLWSQNLVFQKNTTDHLKQRQQLCLAKILEEEYLAFHY